LHAKYNDANAAYVKWMTKNIFFLHDDSTH
jgi:hypothetical protein